MAIAASATRPSTTADPDGPALRGRKAFPARAPDPVAPSGPPAAGSRRVPINGTGAVYWYGKASSAANIGPSWSVARQEVMRLPSLYRP